MTTTHEDNYRVVGDDLDWNPQKRDVILSGPYTTTLDAAGEDADLHRFAGYYNVRVQTRLRNGRWVGMQCQDRSGLHATEQPHPKYAMGGES